MEYCLKGSNVVNPNEGPHGGTFLKKEDVVVLCRLYSLKMGKAV